MTTEDRAESIDGYIRTADAARRLGRSQARIRQLAKEGILHNRFIGRDLWVKEDDVEQYGRQPHPTGRRKRVAQSD